jgi:hypothetical protein
VLESRWLRWVGTGVIALVAIGSVAANAASAGQRPWKAAACTDAPASRAKAAQSAEAIAFGDLRSRPWFRQDPRLDRTGALEGQRLALGLGGERSSRILDLPAESFAAGPFGGVILVGSDDEMRSQLMALDVSAECVWSVAEETASVIRRATIDSSGTTVYEMRVDRATRADRGIWARPLDGSLPAVQVLEPIAPDERFGRTYATEFTWDLSGDRLAVQSCGEVACRTRVYDPAGGPVGLIADADLGTIVGLSGNDLVAYAACPGFPCPVVALELETQRRTVLAEAAAVAVLATTLDGPHLVHEVLTEAGVAVRSVGLDGSGAVDLGPIPAGFRLPAGPNIGQAATTTPTGWVLLGPEGRLPDTGPTAQTQLRHVQDGTTVQFVEVAR